MHVYRVSRGVKRPDIVKENLMFALWSLESKMFRKWSQIYTLDLIWKRNDESKTLTGDNKAQICLALLKAGTRPMKKTEVEEESL